MIASIIENRLIEIVIEAPSLEVLRFFEESLLIDGALYELIEHGLKGLLEHFHADGDLHARSAQILYELKLDSMIGIVVVVFSDIDNSPVADSCDHLGETFHVRHMNRRCFRFYFQRQTFL